MAILVTSKTAHRMFKEALDQVKNGKYGEPFSGVFKDKDVWIGIDNTTRNLWVEEFDCEEQALKFSTGKEARDKDGNIWNG